MAKMPHTRHYHSYIMLISSSNHFIITHRTTWLNNRSDTSFSSLIDTIPEREKGIRCHHRPRHRQISLLSFYSCDTGAVNAFGDAGHRVVIEEFLCGEEASFIVVVAGDQVLPLATSQDHKARDDGDAGPNTGGMGAYSPAPVVTEEMQRKIMDEVIYPTVRGMQADGCPYTGFLYAGIMISESGVPNVLEYNVRFGDPETQPIMLRLQSDLIDLCEAALDYRLEQVSIQWDERPALGVVLAAGGYPGKYRSGDVIEGLDDATGADVKVFHAGTTERDGKIVTQGGRVLCACALGKTVSEAQKKAYELVNKIHWDGMYYRRDIGHRAISRKAE